jgi:hypothetical protein
MRFIDLRKLRKPLDAVDRQLSAFDVAEEEPEDKLAKQEFERQSPERGCPKKATASGISSPR